MSDGWDTGDEEAESRRSKEPKRQRSVPLGVREEAKYPGRGEGSRRTPILFSLPSFV